MAKRRSRRSPQRKSRKYSRKASRRSPQRKSRKASRKSRKASRKPSVYDKLVKSMIQHHHHQQAVRAYRDTCARHDNDYDCGGNPNCNWVNNSCRRKSFGETYAGPRLPSSML